MNSCVCTLFEGDYHFGVAALINSLYKGGFRGAFYAGYRGALPPWAAEAQTNESINWSGAKSLNAAEGLDIHFLPLTTNYHLTNYKPDFMLELWAGPARAAESMFYFDPDIVVYAPWKLFDEWVHCGVSLCEDVNSPLPRYHPRRVAWRQYFGENGIPLQFKDSIYANGGFVGLRKTERSFLDSWKKIQEVMAPKIGGLEQSFLAKGGLPPEARGAHAPFGKTDQDALNACVEAWDGTVSFAGQDAMAFKHGTFLMPHALGSPKPWNLSYLLSALNGLPPSHAQKLYWTYAKGVIRFHSPSYIFLKNISVQTAAFIGRFYSAR